MQRHRNGAARWEKSRDADESYLDEQSWDRIWARAVVEIGVPFKPTAYLSSLAYWPVYRTCRNE